MTRDQLERKARLLERDPYTMDNPAEGISTAWGRPEPRRQHADPIVEELRRGTTLIAVDTAPEVTMREDFGVRHRVANWDDALYGLLEKVAFIGIHHHRNPSEYWNRLLVISGSQHTSPKVADLINTAMRKKLGVYFYDPNTGKIIKHQ